MFESVSSKVDFVGCVTQVDRPHFEQRCAIKSKIKYMLFFFFLRVRGLYTKNLCLQAKLFIKLFTGKSSKGLGGGRDVRNQPLHALGCCTSTPAHVTRQSPSIHFLAGKGIPVVPQPLIFAGSQFLATSFCSPGSETA